MVVVPLYDTLGPNAATYIVNQAQIELVICDDWCKVRKLLTDPTKVPHLKYIVLTEDCPSFGTPEQQQPSPVALVASEVAVKMESGSPLSHVPKQLQSSEVTGYKTYFWLLTNLKFRIST